MQCDLIQRLKDFKKVREFKSVAKKKGGKKRSTKDLLALRLTQSEGREGSSSKAREGKQRKQTKPPRFSRRHYFFSPNGITSESILEKPQRRCASDLSSSGPRPLIV